MTANLPQIQNNSLMPSQEEFNMLQTIARNAQESGLYSGMGQQAKIFMVLLAARELGVSPMLALNGGIWNIQGKIEISARLMNGLIRRAGHSIQIIVSNDSICTLLGKRSDGDSFECTFNMEDATKAGLAGGNVWKKYPADMLYNRCMSRLARRLFSDVIGNAYVEGEIKEAKKVEEEEKKLQMAEYEQLNCETNLQNSPDISIDHIPEAAKMVEHTPRISEDQLKEFLQHYMNTDDTFKENFEKYMQTKWGIKEFQGIAQKDYHACMTSILRNIEMQSMPKGN